MRLWPNSTGSPPAAAASPGGEPRPPNPDAGGWSLRLRLLITVTIALFPIAIASVVQGVDRARSDEAQVHERLVQTTRAASSAEENLLASAEQILKALASLPDVRDAGAACNKNLAAAMHGLSFFTNIARIGANGAVMCAALPAAIGHDASAEPVWKAARVSNGFVVSGQMTSFVAHRNVISVMLPLRDARRRFNGALAIAIDVHWLDFMVHASQLPRGSVVAILDRNHQIIASDNPIAARKIFAAADLHPGDDATLQTGRDGEGKRWSYATSPLIGDSVSVGFAMREASLFGATYIHVGTDFILPFLMIALTWLAIWIVTEQQVTRWIDYLQRISAAYRTGHYAIRPQLDGAPSDFKTLGSALAEMADAIQERDKSLRDAVKQKTVLIKEIHHRVKNNLQIVMSLLSLQANRLTDPAAQDALKQARTRINALALVHRILYEIEDQNVVDIKRLLEDLVEQTHEGFGGERRDLRVTHRIVPCMASSDVAVPVALFTVEALTNVFKHAFPEPGCGGTISVTLDKLDDANLRLTIADDGQGFSREHTDASVGARLITTFGQQVGGTAELRSEPGEGTVAEMVFPNPQTQGGANDDLPKAAE
ncbi:MAG: sensor histidine kinase [Rhizomicrobium sp.]